jgi:ribonuclease P protein component
MTPRERAALPKGDQGELPEKARSPFCFPRTRRIQKRPEFLRVQAEGARVTTKHFVLLLAAQRGERRASRVGITASKHVGNAVARARTRRLVREAFRRSIDLFPPGIDVVVIARTGAHLLGLASVVSEWEGVRGLVKKRSADVLRALAKS